MNNPTFNEVKFQEMILNAALLGAEDPGFDVVKLSYALYYADLAAALETGQSISGAEYRKYPEGPTAVEHPGQLKAMVENGTMKILETRWLGRKIMKPMAQVRPSWQHNALFTGLERELANQAARAVVALTAEQLKAQVETDENWQAVPEMAILPYTEP